MKNEKEVLYNLGQHIKAARKSRQLTQEQLAELCDFDPTYVSMLERGKRNPPFLTLYKLAYYLEYPVKYFMEGIE